MPTKTPIEPSVIERAVQGVRYVLNGVTPDGWFTPGQPLPPIAQGKADGRAFDYDVGVNLRLTPRLNEPISFTQLRALADGYDLLRTVIETRKDQMSRLKFSIVPADDAKEPDSRCKEVEAFLRFPDQEHDWDDWLRMLLEDLLVIDAPTIYPRWNQGGTIYALEPVDGSTVKRIISIDGRTPVPPDAAYQQILKGMPAVDYSRDELIYKPRNVRTHRLYGYSPVEQVIMTVNIALRRQLYQLQYYSEGSTADLIMQVPETWNPDQIKAFDLWWQGRLAGNTAERSKTLFVPSGVAPIDTKDRVLMDQFDEWLARIVCYAFSISPGAFVKDQNRATAGTAKDIAAEEGLQPIMRWVSSLMDMILARYFGYADLRFSWNDERDQDPLQQANINKIYLDARVVTADEIRSDLGLDPLTDEQKAALAPAVPAALLGPDGKPIPGDKLPGVPAGGAPGAPKPPLDTGVAKGQKKSAYGALTANAPRAS